MDKKQQRQIIMLTIGAGLVYYYLIYLPEQKRKEDEARQRLADEEAQRQEFAREQARQEEENRREAENERLRKLENIKKKKLH